MQKRIAAMIIGGLVIGAAVGGVLLSENGYNPDKHPAVAGDNHPAIAGEALNAGSVLAGELQPNNFAPGCMEFLEQDESTAVINGNMENPDVEYLVVGCGGFL